MTQVLADDRDDVQVSSLFEFLRATSGGQFVVHGKSIEVTSLSSREVKFLLRKFLYVNHLSGYGVLYTAGSFEIVHIEPETREEKEEHETLKPTMSLLPLYHPSTHPTLSNAKHNRLREKQATTSYGLCIQ